MSPARVAVLGLNHYHVTGWVDSLAELGDRVALVALHDPDPARGDRLRPDHADPHLAPALLDPCRDLPFEPDLDRLLADHAPDLAIVTLPNAAAPAAIARCAEAGVHVLVDKPAARTVAEAERAFAVARERGVRVAVGLTRRFGQGWRDAAATVASGRLGRLLTTEAVFVTSSVAVRDPANAIFDREAMGGGILHWLGVHDLDLLLWLTGERIVEVQAMTATMADPPVGVEDVVSASLRYASGAVGTAHFAYALPRTATDGYVAIRGTEGSLRLDPGGSWTLTGAGSVRDPTTEQQVRYRSRTARGYGAGGAQMLDDLLRAIAEGRDPLVTDRHMLDVLRVVEAIYRAAATGRRVRVSH